MSAKLQIFFFFLTKSIIVFINFFSRELTDYTSNIIASSAYPQVKLEGISRNRVILEDLAIAKNYEIVVIPFNSQGLGPASRPVSVYVGEAVPTGAPQNVRSQPVSPTEVRLTWNAPQADQQNGKFLTFQFQDV
jgi:protein sidekick